MAFTMPDSKLDQYYQQLIENFKPQEISYQDITTDQKTESEFASAIAAYLEPYKQRSIESVRASERSQRAMMDADAASRGMQSSTYLGDVKRQVSRQAQSDISNLESDYVSQIGQRTAEAYQNQLNRVLNVAQTNAANRMTRDQWNSQERTRAQELAWQRAFQLDNYNPRVIYVGGTPLTEDGLTEDSTNAYAYYNTRAKADKESFDRAMLLASYKDTANTFGR